MNKSYFWAYDHRKGWNFTEFQSFWNDFYRTDENMKYVEFSCLTLLSALSLIVNLYLIITLCLNRRLRTSHNKFVMGIICCTIVWIPFVCLIAATRLTHGWVFGDVACKLSMFMTINTSFVKIVYMAVISLDRYAKIVRGYQISERGRTLLLALPVLIVSACSGYVTIPNTFAQEIEYQEDHFYICTAAFEYHETIRVSMAYLLTIFTTFFILPTVIIFACYAKIMLSISRSAKAVRYHSRASTKSCNKQRLTKRRRMTTTVLIMIALLFVIMWMPLFGCLAALTLDHVLEIFQMSSRVMIACVSVTVANSVIEPLLYTLTARSYRQECLYRCCLRRRKDTISSIEDNTMYTSSSS